MDVLSGVRKGDALALVSTGGWCHPTTAVKVFVKKKNPASVVFEYKGEEHRVGLDGRGRLLEHVEVWDDVAEAERVQRAAAFLAGRALDAFRQIVSPMPHSANLEVKDVLREPALFEELQALRAAYAHDTEALCQRIRASRPETDAL